MHELVGPGDGVFLEVVAEAEVAQHLEEGEMALGRTDDVDVDGPHHLLHRRRTWKGGMLLTEEVGLEGHHPGVGEQQRGVDRDQGSRWAHDMALFLEERGEKRANLVAVQLVPGWFDSRRG